MNEIVKYEKMIIVELKNNRKLITFAKNRERIESNWKKHEVQKIEGVTVDGYAIFTIEDAGPDYDMLSQLKESKRVAAQDRFKLYHERLGKWPNREEKAKLISIILSDEKI